MGVQVVGWVSSLILVLTIATQIHKQWREGASEGVSPWLFVGQIVASGGFALYSWLIEDWVFIATNTLMLGNGVAGTIILLRNRRRTRRAGVGRPATSQ
jgi:MtN3 and saliva related transmembrane protein